MTPSEKIERGIGAHSDAELAEFRRWYAEFDAALWDRQLAADAASDAPDRLADGTLAEHRAGHTRPL